MGGTIFAPNGVDRSGLLVTKLSGAGVVQSVLLDHNGA